MSKILKKTIGYFAIYLPVDVLCEGEACVIAGSQSALNRYKKSLIPDTEYQNRKTSLGEILEGLSRGGAYAFDEESYNLFYPLANKHGYNLKREEFLATESGFHFVTIKSIKI